MNMIPVTFVTVSAREKGTVISVVFRER